LRQQAAELARQKLVLISGPPGTEKRALAWEVHHAGPDPDAPFLVLDAQAVTLTGQPAADEMELELSQACTLLGLRPGSLHLAGATRLGLLRAADGGTLVIENAESLAESLDIQLSDFVQTGRYQPLADDRRWASSVRLILTATQMRPDSRLAALARGSILVLPPLKQRKQDLLPMIEHLAREHGRLQGKNLRGIEPEAHARLMAYDWPGQTDELEVVIRRAASLAQGELLSADDVFLTASPSSSGGVLNLLTFTNPGRGALRGLLVGATVAGIAAFAFLLWQGWMGARAPHGRAALALTWVFWEPVIIFGSFFAARVWCSVCPIGAISGLISRVGLRRRVPLWLRDQGAWIPAAGVGAILWAQAAWDMNNSIRATAVLIWAILVPAVLMSVFYKRRAFCRYICPLGQMIGALSTCSTTELRGNAGICGTDCQDHRCYVGTGGKEGCPVFEGPFTLRSNTQCVVCFACVRTCTNASPAWNLRLPGAELWTATKPFSDLTVLIPALLGAQFFRSLVRAGLATRWSTPLELAVLCAAFVLVFTILARKAAEAIFSHEDRGYFIHALAMLAAAWEFSYQAGLLLTLAGTGWPPIMSLWAVDVFQAGLCLVGLGASLVVLRELIRRRAARPNAVIRFSLVGIGALEAFMQFLG
jgi:polyferredoxin